MTKSKSEIITEQEQGTNSALEVQIRNYQMHSNTNLEFPEGITAIIGESEQGKSCIFKAVETCLYNLPRPHHVKQGTKGCIVGLRYNGNQVIYKRVLNAKSPVQYKVNSETLSKVGRTQPQEIADILGFRELEINETKYRLNFMKQMKYPFLLDKSPADLFKFIMSSEEEDRLLGVIDTMKSDLKQLNIQITKAETERDVLKQNALEQKQLYDDKQIKVEYADKCLSLETKVKDIEYLEEILAEGRELKNQIDMTKEKISNLNQRIQTLEKLSEINLGTPLRLQETIVQACQKKIEINKINNEIKLSQAIQKKLRLPMDERIKPLRTLLSRGNELKVEVDMMKEKIKNIKPATELQFPDIEPTTQLAKIVNRLSELDKEIAELTIDKTKTQSKLSEAEQGLKEFKVCPFCNQSLENHKHNDEV